MKPACSAQVIDLSDGASDDDFRRARQALEQARVLLCDLDGCLVMGERVMPGAADFIGRNLNRVRIVSNNSSLAPEPCSRWLHRLGMPIPAEHIFLAGTVGLDEIQRSHPGARVRLFGSRDLKVYARQIGLRVVTGDADLVFVAKDIRMPFGAVPKVAAAAADGAPLWVSNDDPSRPVGQGVREVETGVQLAAIRAYAPALAFQIIGKPHAPLFKAALAFGGEAPRDALMLGDTWATDIAGAAAMNIPALLVDPERPAWAQLLEGQD